MYSEIEHPAKQKDIDPLNSTQKRKKGQYEKIESLDISWVSRGRSPQDGTHPLQNTNAGRSKTSI